MSSIGKMGDSFHSERCPKASDGVFLLLYIQTFYKVIRSWASKKFMTGCGKSVGILGLSRIGSAIAKRAKSFGCSISYCSRNRKPHNPDYNYYETATELASNCDVLVVSCPFTDETRHIINRQVMDALGPTGVLVNVGRGAHVDEPELVVVLLEGWLGRAGLDVFKNEPDIPEELFGMENVVVQSHVGSDTVETCKDMAHLVLVNLEAHVMNHPLLTSGCLRIGMSSIRYK